MPAPRRGDAVDDPYPPRPPLDWRRPEGTAPKAVDAVEVARLEHGVLIRSTLSSVAVTLSAHAWADFTDAVKHGEFDHPSTPVPGAPGDEHP